MSHTTKIDDWTFIHDGDVGTGDVHISSPFEGEGELTISERILIEFLGRRLQSHAISELEQLSGADFLLLRAERLPV